MLLDRAADPMVGHLARLLLLVEALSSDGRSVRALSAIARHDFLLRYPVVLERVLAARDIALPPELGARPAERRAIEARMLRYKFGVWDHRYYPLIGRLVAMHLVDLERMEAPIQVRLSARGHEAADQLRGHRWALLRGRGQLLATHLHVTGYQLGRLIEEALKR